MHNSKLPLVVLLGRPNVGKSTLFNRLIRSNRAITHDRPGVTRDRMEGVVRSKGKRPFAIMDTGGVTLDSHARVEEGPEGIRGFESAILEQAKEAIAGADLLCLVVDARDGLTPFDQHLASFLRRESRPLLLVVNKVDGPERAEILAAEFHSLGLEMVQCSAAHGYNVRELELALREKMFADMDDDGEQTELDSPEPDDAHPGDDSHEPGDDSEGSGGEPADSERPAPARPDGPLRLALLGRPNAGKSSLVNALAGKDRMIVSNVAGTTRDSVDVAVNFKGEPCVFVDTAGVRRRSKITDVVERYSVNSSLKTTSKADVTLLMLDAGEGLTLQDKRLIDLLDERKTPFMVLVNKSDLIPDDKRKSIEKDFKEALQFCKHVPLLFICALNRRNIAKIVPLAKRIRQECSTRITTGVLNKALESMLSGHQPPMIKGVRAKFYYLTQAEILPPTFVFFVNNADLIATSYARYLDRTLREHLQIKHAPIRIHFRSSHKGKKDKK